MPVEKPHPPVLMPEQLEVLVRKIGHDHHYSGPKKQHPVLQGHFGIGQHSPGLQIHVFNGFELSSGKSSIKLAENLSFSLLLAGKLEFSIDDKKMFIDAEKGGQSFAYNLLKPAKFERATNKGQRIHKVNVSVTHQWLADHWHTTTEEFSQLKSFLQTHCDSFHDFASVELIRVGKELISAHAQNSPIHHLETESIAIRFIAESLRGLCSDFSRPVTNRADSAVVKSSVNSKANKLMLFIDEQISYLEGNSTNICLKSIAKKVGMSISNMQRHFKKNQGQTIIHYIRQRRLEFAREAMENRGVSIGEAAYLAGYKHSSNFSLAFKRQFGISPGTIGIEN